MLHDVPHSSVLPALVIAEHPDGSTYKYYHGAGANSFRCSTGTRQNVVLITTAGAAVTARVPTGLFAVSPRTTVPLALHTAREPPGNRFALMEP